MYHSITPRASLSLISLRIAMQTPVTSYHYPAELYHGPLCDVKAYCCHCSNEDLSNQKQSELATSSYVTSQPLLDLCMDQPKRLG